MEIANLVTSLSQNTDLRSISTASEDTINTTTSNQENLSPLETKSWAHTSLRVLQETMASIDTIISAFACGGGSLGSTTTAIQMADSSEPTFTCFPKLPPELKLRIWKFFNTPEPRDVEVIIRLAYGDMKNNYKTSTPIPSILMYAPMQDAKASRHIRICSISISPANIRLHHTRFTLILISIWFTSAYQDGWRIGTGKSMA